MYGSVPTGNPRKMPFALTEIPSTEVIRSVSRYIVGVYVCNYDSAPCTHV